MPAKYKLIYFNVTGRAEMVRTMFAAACVEYEDERIKMADWPKLKAGKEAFKLRDFGNLCFFCLVYVMPLCVSVYLCLVVTCRERADLLALVCGV